MMTNPLKISIKLSHDDIKRIGWFLKRLESNDFRRYPDKTCIAKQSMWQETFEILAKKQYTEKSGHKTITLRYHLWYELYELFCQSIGLYLGEVRSWLMVITTIIGPYLEL